MRAEREVYSGEGEKGGDPGNMEMQGNFFLTKGDIKNGKNKTMGKESEKEPGGVKKNRDR